MSKEIAKKKSPTSQSPIRTSAFSQMVYNQNTHRDLSKGAKKELALSNSFVKKDILDTRENILLRKIQKLKQEKQELIQMLKKSESILSLKLKEGKEESSKINDLVKKLIPNIENQDYNFESPTSKDQLAILTSLLKKENAPHFCENCGASAATLSTNASSNGGSSTRRSEKTNNASGSMKENQKDAMYNSEIANLKNSLDISLKRELEYRSVIKKAQESELYIKDENQRLGTKVGEMRAQLETLQNYFNKRCKQGEELERKNKNAPVNSFFKDPNEGCYSSTRIIPSPLPSVLKLLNLNVTDNIQILKSERAFERVRTQYLNS